MMAELYRYQFDKGIPTDEVGATLILALLGAEALHGAAQTRLDAAHTFDPKARAVTIDAGTPVGRDLNRLFIGFVTREFGPDAVRVTRRPKSAPRARACRTEPVTA